VDSNDYGGYAVGQVPHPNDPSSLRAYTEQYTYDKVGNFEQVRHSEDGGPPGRGSMSTLGAREA